MIEEMKERLRMFQWALTAAALYFAAFLLVKYPQAQIICMKLGHITLASYAGYWVDRHAFRDRLGWDSPSLFHVRRAMIISAAILAMAMGL